LVHALATCVSLNSFAANGHTFALEGTPNPLQQLHPNNTYFYTLPQATAECEPCQYSDFMEGIVYTKLAFFPFLASIFTMQIARTFRLDLTRMKSHHVFLMTWIIMLEGPLPWIGFLFCEYFFKFLHWAYGDFVLELCTDIYTLLGMIFGSKKKRKKSKKKKVPLQKPKYKIEPDTSWRHRNYEWKNHPEELTYMYQHFQDMVVSNRVATGPGSNIGTDKLYSAQSGYEPTLPWQLFFYKHIDALEISRRLLVSWIIGYISVLLTNMSDAFYALLPFIVFSPPIIYMCFIVVACVRYIPKFRFYYNLYHRSKRYYMQSGIEDKDYRRERYQQRSRGLMKHEKRHKEMMRMKHKQIQWRTNRKKNKTPVLPENVTGYMAHSSPGSVRFERVYDTIGALQKLATGKNADCDHLISELEEILLLLVVLADCRSWKGFSAALAKHLKIYLKGSVYSFIKDLFSDVDLDGYSAQSGDIFDDSVPLWLEQFRFAVTNWREARSLPAFSHVSRILSICVAAGMCKAADVNIKLGNLTLFAVNAQEKHKTCFDLMDAVMSTVSYFVEAGYESHTTGSLRPFLYDNQDARKLDEDYMRVRDAMRVFSAGNLELLNADDTAPNVIKTEVDLANAIQSLFRRYGHAKQFATDGMSKSVINHRFIEIQEWRMEFLAKSQGGTLRESPYTFLIFGRSAIGKSTIVNKMVRALLCEIGEDHKDPKRVVTINPTDKFVSNAKSDTLAFIFDDMGAETMATAESNPSRRWIDYSNNIRTYALKAEVQDKGVTCIQHKVQAGTANFADGGMDAYCNYKVAAARRGTRDKIELKPEYSLNGKLDKRLVSETFGDELFPDIYNITIFEAIEVKGQDNGEYELEPVKWKGVKLVNISYKLYAEYHLAKAVEHFEEQKLMLKNNGQATDKMNKCPKCKHVICKCDGDEDVSLHSSDEEVPEPTRTPAKKPKYAAHLGRSVRRIFGWWFLTSAFNYFFGNLNFMERWLVKRTSAVVMSTLHYYVTSRITFWYRLIPDVFWETQIVTNFRVYMLRKRYSMTLRFLTVSVYVNFALALFAAHRFPRFACVFFVLAVAYYLFAVVCMKVSIDILMRREENSHQCLIRLREIRQDTALKYILGGIAFISTALWLYRAYKGTDMDAQGNLAPTSIEEVEQRDAEKSDWAVVESTPLPISHKSKSTNCEQLCTTLSKNLLYVRRKDSMLVAPFCDAIALKGHSVMLPRHMLTKDARTFEFYRKGEEKVGAYFSMKASLDSATHIPGTDYSILQGNGGGPFASILDYFPDEIVDCSSAKMIYRQKDGTLLKTGKFRPLLRKHLLSTNMATFRGYEYKLDVNTFEGMCMAPLISDGVGSAIIGFHLGGNTGKPDGCAGVITKPMVEEALIRYHTEHPSGLDVASSGTLYQSHLGITFFESAEIHAKSPTRFLEKGSNIDVHGSVKGRCKYFSDVIPTPIASIVKRVCNYHTEYAGPDFGSGTAFRDSLVHSSKPSQGVEQSLLDRSFRCLKKSFVKLLAIPALVTACRPLSEIETVSGQDGIRFVDALKSKTSMGYPINSPKNKYLIDLPPSEEHKCPRTLPSEFWKEAERWESEYLAGRRCYALFRGCLKDEPTKKGKKKVRVFQASPIVLQLLVRKYYLPIARLLSVNPLLSECAVGINAHGPEWDQLQAHIKKFGANRILAGDYSKYDLRTPAQFTSAAFRMMCDIAEMTGNYTERDLTVMRGLATDIVYPVMAYKGDLIQLFGSTPSGHNLTVYVNSIVNSLLLRCAYYTIYPNGEDFADVCSVSTYGDDFKGSVKPGYDKFNHIAVRDVFATFGVVITMPDKESTPVPFMEDALCDYLKRHNEYFPELGMYVGKLDENSIFKSLLAVLKSSFVTPGEQAAMNIDGALEEWFYYGRAHFRMRQEQMIQVAEEAGITHMCRKLYDTFEDRVATWHEKYIPNGVPVSGADFSGLDVLSDE
jgi:hypothetical protein